jgi:CRP-like cAMP-binding protein
MIAAAQPGASAEDKMVSLLESVNARPPASYLPMAPKMLVLNARPDAADDTRPAAWRIPRDGDIFVQDAAATHFYMLLSGCVRSVRLMNDGRRQVAEFYFPGDIFGWEAIDRHDYAAEAVTACTVQRFRREELETLALKDSGFAHYFHVRVAARLRASREHLLLLGRQTAPERVLSFLLEMAERLSPGNGARIELPMSRSDMADYLGLTVETVCRQLTLLRGKHAIAVERAKVVLFDRTALLATAPGRMAA